MAKCVEMIDRIINSYRNGEIYSFQCDRCNIPLNQDYTGIHSSDNCFFCDDCYYEAWGDLVEEHPIISPAYHPKKEI